MDNFSTPDENKRLQRLMNTETLKTLADEGCSLDESLVMFNSGSNRVANPDLVECLFPPPEADQHYWLADNAVGIGGSAAGKHLAHFHNSDS